MVKKDIEIQPGFKPGSSCNSANKNTFQHQFAGGSTKYFGPYHAEFPKPKRDPA